MDGLNREIEALDAAAVARKEAKAAFDAQWRKLKGLHEGLSAEYATRIGARGKRTINPRDIRDEMETASNANLAVARFSAEKAEKALSVHLSGGGLLRRFSRGFKARERELRRCAEILRGASETMERDLAFKRKGFEARSKSMADENARANEVELAPFSALRQRVGAFEVALKAVQSGNEPSVACLARDDIETLLTVAATWLKLCQDDPVGDVEYGLYLRAKHPPTVRPVTPQQPPPPPPDSFLALMDRLAEAMTSGHFGRDAFGRAGRVVDGEWEEIPHPSRRQIPLLIGPDNEDN